MEGQTCASKSSPSQTGRDLWGQFCWGYEWIGSFFYFLPSSTLFSSVRFLARVSMDFDEIKKMKESVGFSCFASHVSKLVS